MNYPDPWKTTRGFAKARALQREGKGKPLPSPVSPHPGFPLENGIVMKFADPKCEACSGSGEVRIKSPKADDFEPKLCLCAMKRVMAIEGVEPDEFTGKLVVRVPAEMVGEEALAGLNAVTNALASEAPGVVKDEHGDEAEDGDVEVPEVQG